MDFTTNDECGLLIEGHERKPLILEGWHHPYYLELLEGWGLGKAMDLYMWELRLDKVEDKGGFHPLIHADREEGDGRARRDGPQHAPASDLESEIAHFLEVYNQAWAHNWAFVPLDETEARWYTKNLRPILDENWTWIAERDGEVLGAALTLPDINRCLQHMNGRLLPFGWAKFLWHRRKIDACRVLALGVKPEYQDLGHRRRPLRRAHQPGRPRAEEDLVGGDGLDPRDQRRHESRDGGHGRQDRAPLPGLREGARAGGQRRGAGLGNGRAAWPSRPAGNISGALYTAASCQPTPAPTGGSVTHPCRSHARPGPSSSRASSCWRCRFRAAPWPSLRAA